MSEVSTLPATAPAGYVRADAIVTQGLTAISKPIGIGAQAKALGVAPALVRAKHYAQQGAALALSSAITGTGRAATVRAYADAELSAIVNASGVIDNHRAMVSVVMVLGIPYTYEEAIRADGQHVVKRAEWLRLGDTLTAKLATTDIPKAVQARYTRAAKLWNAIQSRADDIRASMAPALQG